VALDEGTYKTVGVSFEFGGLTENQFTQEELMILILEFFGGILTDVEENPLTNNGFQFSAWPNPFGERINFSLEIEMRAYVNIEIYTLNGQKVMSLANGEYNKGTHQFNWDGSNMPSGMYIYKIQMDDQFETGKAILKH
jgi:hypothetical protein